MRVSTMGGARVFLPGGQRAGHGGAVADPGLVIGVGPWEGFEEDEPSPTARGGLGAGAKHIFR